MVERHGIDQQGSCFAPEVFSPVDFDPADYWDALRIQMREEQERKQAELRVRAGIEAWPRVRLVLTKKRLCCRPRRIRRRQWEWRPGRHPRSRARSGTLQRCRRRLSRSRRGRRRRRPRLRWPCRRRSKRPKGRANGVDRSNA